LSKRGRYQFWKDKPMPDWNRARAYVAAVSWTWAKTYAKTFPHWYTVRSRMPELDSEFCWFAQFIRDFGMPAKFFRNTHIYLELDGWKYWTMGNPITKTSTRIINREEIKNEP